MSKHSPGPWMWEINDVVPADSPEWKEANRLADANGATVLSGDTDNTGATWVSVRHADAALIAAAPRLLELLRKHPGLECECLPEIRAISGTVVSRAVVCWNCRRDALLAEIGEP